MEILRGERLEHVERFGMLCMMLGDCRVAKIEKGIIDQEGRLGWKEIEGRSDEN